MGLSALARAAIPDDAGAVARIASAAYSVYLPRLPEGVRPAPMDADYGSAIERGDVWVAEHDGTVAGFVVLVAMPDHLLLENVAVGPEAQGKGVGRMLLQLAEERAVALGLASIRLYTHVVMLENQALYERLGYVETERRHDGPFERVFYEKRL